ncbi:MAG: ribbon-helix-helix domain-containing protein [Aliidongia sp.]
MAKRPSLADSMRKLEPAAVTSPAASVPAAEREAAAPKGYYAATRAGRKKVTAALEPDAHKQLKLLAVDRSQTVEDLLREAISDLFRKYGKPPIA